MVSDYQLVFGPPTGAATQISRGKGTSKAPSPATDPPMQHLQQFTVLRGLGDFGDLGVLLWLAEGLYCQVAVYGDDTFIPGLLQQSCRFPARPPAFVMASSAQGTHSQNPRPET